MTTHNTYTQFLVINSTLLRSTVSHFIYYVNKSKKADCKIITSFQNCKSQNIEHMTTRNKRNNTTLGGHIVTDK